MEADEQDRMWFMQDNAPSHVSRYTIAELERRVIQLLRPWPANSPDLNPIETIWNRMKDWIQRNYPPFMKLAELRVAVTRAWNEGITSRDLCRVLDSMPSRMATVLQNNGGPIAY